MVLQRFMVHDFPRSGRPGALTAREIGSEEARYIALARNGEQSGYTYLLQQYRATALRLATHVLRRPDEAEDVAQEAFVRAFRSLHSLRQQSSFKPWLCQIVVRICFERQKARGWQEAPLDFTAEAVHTTTDNTDTRLLVSQLLAELSPALRAALVLYEIEGLSYEEVAKALDIPVGTVRSRLAAARTRFRQLYEAVEKETHNV